MFSKIITGLFLLSGMCFLPQAAFAKTAKAAKVKTVLISIEQTCANLNSKSSVVREGAMKTLGSLLGAGNHSDEMNTCLAGVNLQAISRIIEVARRQDHVKADLIMAWVTNPIAANTMIDIMRNDPAWELRESAALSLGRMKSIAGIIPLINSALGDTNQGVRNCARMSLYRLGNEAIPELQKLDSDQQSFAVRQLVSEAIERIKTDSIDTP